jgi:hypothetical protein
LLFEVRAACILCILSRIRPLGTRDNLCQAIPMTPNWFAVFALIVWPLMAIALYATRPVVQATLSTLLGAQLFLPVGTFFKFEMIPQFDKASIPSLCAVLGCMFMTGKAVKPFSKFGSIEVLIAMYLTSPVITSLLNGDPIVVGGTVLPGVGLYDGLSTSLSQFIILIPFFLGRQFLRGSNDVQSVFSALVIASVGYSVLLLFEIRMSPQLHFWLYGYYPSDFIQEMREGGSFRPMVFMGHGLVAGFFAMTAVVASAVIWRARMSVFRVVSPGLVTGYLAVVLVLCKSGAALIYGAALAPLVRWTKPRLQLRFAIVLAALALTYPIARMSEIFPTDTIVSVAMSINEGRAASLKFRFDQEEALLERASRRFLFGWGRYGRNRVYGEDWRGVGVDASVTDGRWIITLGQFGVFGFLAEFGLLAITVLRALIAVRVAETFRETVFLAGLALIVSVNIVELLPNSTLLPWTWLLAGTLLGRSEAMLVAARKPRKNVDVIGRVEGPMPHAGGYAGFQRP